VADNALVAESRSGTGKGVARKLRARGRIPAVVYGNDAVVEHLSVDARSLDRLLHTSTAGYNTLIDLQLDDRSQVVLLKELQRDPVRGAFVHADFLRIDLKEEVEVSVNVRLVGEPRGVKLDGGILDHALREIEVRCLPTAIPEHVDVDVSQLQVGESIHVSDLPLPPGVELMTDRGLSIASVVAPAVAEEAAEGAEVEEVAAAAAAPAEAGEESGEES